MTTRPAWLDQVAEAVRTDPPEHFARFAPPERPRRQAAVLMLFGPTGEGPVDADGVTGVDVVLTERSATLRSHAGQISFPGGGLDPGDDGPVGAALRESEEEVGLDPASVDVVAELPTLYMSPSGNAVVPVLGWWPQPGAIDVVDPAEVARVARVPLDVLLDPAHRFTVATPSGFASPAFDVDGLFVWGFTAMLLDVLFDTAHLTRPWDRSVRRPIPRSVRPSLATMARYAVGRAAGR